MLYRVPYTYIAAVVRKGARNIEPEIFGAWVDVDIPHFTSDDIPVSMAVELEHEGEPKTLETRFHDGCNWLPAIVYDRYFSSPAFTPAELNDLHNADPSVITMYSHAVEQDTMNLYSLLNKLGGADQNVIEEFDPAKYRSVHHSFRQEIETKTIQNSSNLIFIDNQLWMKRPEFHYSIAMAGQSYWIIPSLEFHQHWALGHFRADRLEDAIDYVRNTLGAEDVTVKTKIDVFIPDAVQFDDERDFVLRKASTALHFGGKNLEQLSSLRIIAWTKLRDCLADNTADTDTIMRTLAEFGEVCPNVRDVTTAVESASRRWELRPVDFMNLGM